ncbi:MAG: amidase family protein [Thermodesulfobacteriota bacterium]|nr:amidase family protein [Thermodesulfobacteriota bacterium]
MNSSVFSFIPPSLKPAEKNALRIVLQPGMSCRGWPATAGSKALENFTAVEDAHITGLLKKTSAVLTGTSYMSEMGFGLKNDTASQVLVQELADAAIITDNMGEARYAAACTGLTGFKPSYGIVSRAGLIGLIPSMECPAIVARHISDIQYLMNAICVHDDRDFSMHSPPLPDFSGSLSRQPAAKTIGVPEGYENSLSKAEITAWEKALSALKQTGCRIRFITMPEPALFSAVHNIIGSVEASSSTGKYDGVRYGHRTKTAENWNEMYLKTRGESFGSFIKSYIFQGACFQFQKYHAFENACRMRGHLLDRTLAALETVDALASLTRRKTPDAFHTSTIKDTCEAFSLTLPANVTGLPAVQLPGLSLCQDKDFGLQLTGKPLGDPALLGIAHHLESISQGEPAS